MVSFGNLPNGLGPSPVFGSAKVTENVTLMQAGCKIRLRNQGETRLGKVLAGKMASSGNGHQMAISTLVTLGDAG
jgi:hypothetical protein